MEEEPEVSQEDHQTPTKSPKNSRGSGSSPRRQNANRSNVWQFITCDRDARIARCTLCNKTMKYTGGTTNLRYHLTAAHHMQEFEVAGPSARVYKEASPALAWKPNVKKRSKLPTFRMNVKGGALTPTKAARSAGAVSTMGAVYVSSKSGVCVPERTLQVNSSLVMMLAQSLLPVGLVEDEGFTRFVQMLEPGYAMIPKCVARDTLVVKYEEAQEKLKICLNKDAKNFGLMFDVWAGCDKSNYMTLTIHYLTNQWTRESWVLGTDRLSVKPSCSELSLCIRNLLSQYQLSLESITAVMNRQGMLKGAQVGKVGSNLLCDSMSCAAEKLEQCVQLGLQTSRIKETIEDLVKLVSYLHQNEEAKAMFSTAKLENKNFIDFDKNPKGAWLSTADTLIKAVALRDVVDTVKLLDDKNQQPYLTEDQWDMVTHLAQSLQVFKAALTVLSDTKSGSVACLLPVVHSMLQHCEGREDDGSPISEFLSVIAKEVRDKWDLNAIMPSSVTMLSSLLDPRFKQLKFIADEDKLDVIDALKHLVTANSTQHAEVDDQSSSNVSPFLCLFGEDEFNAKPGNTDTEVSTYLSHPPLARDMCPLDWWRMNQGKFPELAKIARCYLAVPAIAQDWGDIVTGTSKMDMKRALLEEETAAPLIFLHKNWSILS